MFSYVVHTDKIKTENRFNLVKGDYDKLREFLNINWDNAFEVSDSNCVKGVNDMWEIFKHTMTDGMYSFIPRTSSGTVIRHKNFQPFNPELKQLIHKKQTLEPLAIHTRKNL